jgi:hypothetical protein
MGAVESRNANTATFDLCHESHYEWNRKTLRKAKFDFDDEILVDGNREKSGEAFGHAGLIRVKLCRRQCGDWSKGNDWSPLS